MLTCKVGENIINCFDNTYDKYQLKKWSDKNILICPDCGKSYEYCHGQIVPPYFRHKEKNKDCDGIYSEPETKEHIDGKLFLYNWLLDLQEQGIVCNVRLEGYIPETKQRPDLYFDYNGIRNVIEFQCTPIATEYLERHQLYQLANVNDIWILGIDKYNFNINEDGFIYHNQYYKTIEKYTNYHLNVKTKEIYIKPTFIIQHLKYNKLPFKDYYAYSLKSFSINQDGLMLDNSIIQEFIILDQKKYEDNIEKYKEEDRQRKIRDKIRIERKLFIGGFNDRYTNLNFKYREGYPPYYLWGVDLSCNGDDYVFFIKNDCIDYCSKNYGWRGRPIYSNKDSFKGNIDEKTISTFILKHVNDLSLKLKIKQEKKNVLFDVFDKNIKIVTNDYIVPKEIRFRCLRECNLNNDEYILNTFANEIRKLSNNEEIVFMICDGDIKDITMIIHLLKYHGFKNVNALTNCKQKHRMNF